MIENHIRNGTIVPVEVTCGLLHQVKPQTSNFMQAGTLAR